MMKERERMKRRKKMTEKGDGTKVESHCHDAPSRSFVGAIHESPLLVSRPMD
jgi:hypothetical protein